MGIFCLTGCNFNNEVSFNDSDYELVEFQFPYEVFGTDNYPELIKWVVEIESAEVSEKFICTENHVKVKVQKNEPLCILATPVTRYEQILQGENEKDEEKDIEKKDENVQKITEKNFTFFKPAGSVYPYTKNQLSWNQGITAKIMHILWNSKKETELSTEDLNSFIGSFNWKKMAETVDSKIDKSVQEFEESKNENKKYKAFYNPWQISFSSLLDNLSYGDFSATSLNTKSVYLMETSSIDNTFFVSSFIPENKIIQNYNYCTVQKNSSTVFLCSKKKLAYIEYTSAKNFSVTYVSLPIFSEEL